ncbi:hypothetical protein HOP62_02880 [Halomonas sp. MCCC 1A17488]|uniref:Homeodomain transcription factor HD2 n=1 Tax=Billgrantia sulfidoxydans TaxID=2733484 RepID=A0ABX7W4F6_9GAMM|nr:MULTISPECIES: hypothetical protein [Halomonas]MCE8015017.1 hypothetical protein [Halomonas sp. MCCC 1A17488]MCG3238350.1 hypothetical protein [Halomonas sp. MCCC 1A17488]QPP47901.1 hypothetical protein I4484_11520 [Halomonas sp. SS10-MC5]QTP55204.1 hypothetical protein HNO51_11225 [Halomonas sulfidoxydans]
MASTTPSHPHSHTPAFGASQPMIEWWSQQCMQGFAPVTRFQLAWMECTCEMLQQEARFFAALSAAGEQLNHCYETHGADPEKMQECYKEIAREVADHHMERLKQVAILPQEFRRRIWEEI